VPTWREIVQRLAYLRRGDRFDRELDEEMQFHIDMRAEDLERDGLTRDAARRQAFREFGSRARIGEDTRAAWQFRWLEDLALDLRYGTRMLRRSPGFTTVAILSLGIGVAATSVMFTVVNGLLLQPPGIPSSNEVVALVSTARESGPVTVSYPDYAAIRDRNQSFQGVAAFGSFSTGLAPKRGAEPHVKSGKLVTASFFSLIGARPELGHAFPENSVKSARVDAEDSIAILSHACWQTDFGADPNVLGTDALINGEAFTIVGVMPAQFTDVDDDLSDDAPDFYVPLGAAKRLGTMPDLLTNRGERVLVAFARLKSGVPITRARAEVATIAGALARAYPDTNRDRSLTVRSILDYRSGGGSGIAAGSLAMGLAGMVLLVACANVAGLLTSRAPARAQEIAMRLAIGAGRPRLVRQLLTESLLLAAGGGLVGLVIGYVPVVFGKRLVIEFDPQMVRFYPFVVNTRVLAFNIAVAVSSVVLFGLAPAFRATRTDLVSVIKGATGSPRRRRFLARWFGGRQWLVAAQVAIALLLLTVTTVVYAGTYKDLIRSFRNPGFEVAHLLAVDFDPTTVHHKGARATAFFNTIATRLRATNGVRAAAVEYQDVALIRPDSPNARDDVRVSGVWIDEGFFDTLGIPIAEGRGIGRRDLDRAPTVAVVNDALANHYWPGRSAVGKQIHLHTGEWITVVGVARLKAFMAFGTPPMDTIFLPYGAPSDRNVRLLVRSTGDPRTLAEPIHAIVRDLDPDQAIPDATPWQTSLGVFVDATLLALDTLGGMGGLGLVLALVGLYGLIAYDVSSRTREFGIRMALGARAASVVRMVLRQGLAVAACGVGAGLMLTWLTVRILDAFFSGTGSGPGSAPDPTGGSQINLQIGTDFFGGHSFTALVIAVLIVTTLAAYLPARRVLRVDPNVALRME
jgi:predicted permease